MHTCLTYLVRESRKALLTQTLTSSTVSRRVAAALAEEAWGGKSKRQDITYHSFEIVFASASLSAMTSSLKPEQVGDQGYFTRPLKAMVLNLPNTATF